MLETAVYRRFFNQKLNNYQLYNNYSNAWNYYPTCCNALAVPVICASGRKWTFLKVSTKYYMIISWFFLGSPAHSLLCFVANLMFLSLCQMLE